MFCSIIRYNVSLFIFSFCLSFFFFATNIHAQNCLQIERILVDACNQTSLEPNNEMVSFKNGQNPLSISNISIAGAPASGVFAANKWPTNSLSWYGLVQTAATASVTASLQSTVVSSCGKLIEPPGGIIPAHADVIMVCSTTPSTTDNSFANLADTLYIVYHAYTYTVTTGHFANWSSGSSTRGLILFDNAHGCSDTVSYDVSLLSSQTNGDAVSYDAAGNATYYNIGCQAPFIPLTANAGAGGTVCQGSTINLTGTAGGTYSSVSWSGGTGTFTNSTSLNTGYIPSFSESGAITLTLTVTSSCGTQAVSTVTITVQAAPNAQITASGPTTFCQGNSVTLSVSGGTTYSWSTGTTASSITVNSSGTYSVTASAACGSNTAQQAVTVNPLPTATITGTQTICSGNSISLTASGGTIYSWNTGSTDATITDAPTTGTTYSVNVSDGNCSAVATASVTVNAVPSAAISGNTNICNGDIVTLTASGIGTYLWNTDSTTTSITDSPTTNISYTVTLTNANNCSATATVAVNVLSAPITSIAGNNTICSGQNTTLTASGGTNYAWSTGATTSVISISPISPFTYSVIASSGSCSDTTSITVSVNATPTVNITGNNSLCLGQTSTLTASGGGTYLWNTGATTASITDSPTTTASYTVIAINVNGCSDTATASVNVLSAPVVNITGNNTICSGQNATLTASGGTDYSWNTGSTSASINVNPTSITNYSVTVSVGSCMGDTSITVTVNPLPVPAISPVATICNGQSITLTSSGGANYSWNTGTTGSVISVNPTAATNYTVTVNDTNACSATATTSVAVNTVVANIGGTSSICIGSTATLSASGGTNYSWNTGAATALITVNPGTTTNYTVVVSEAFGCADTAMATVIVSQPPIAGISGNNIVCEGDVTALTASGGTTYLWSTGATSSSITVNPASTTNYSVMVSNGSCMDDTNITVTVNGLPSANAGPDITVTIGDSATLNGSGSGTYIWTPSTNLSCTICPNPVATPSTTTTYTLVVTDANGCMAIDNTTIFVTIPECILHDEDIFIPNVFSPNGDGHNDHFVIHSTKPCIKDFELSIYDRWGVVVFKTNLIADAWDGTANGLKVNDGAYFYICQITANDDRVIHKNGNITVLR